VLKGTFTVAHDGSPDKTPLAPGGFLYMPAKMIHEAWTGEGDTTYFITPKRVTIVVFESMEKAQAYLAAPEYTALATKRHKAAKFRSFLVSGGDEAQ
jgi:hypothetical protein